MTLLVSEPARGLFQRAIIQSGGTALTTPAAAESWTDDAEPGHRKSSNEVVARLLVASRRAHDRADARRRIAAVSPGEIAGWLRATTPAALFAAYSREEQEALLDVPQLFADGVVFPDAAVVDRFASEDGWSRVPVMVGTNKDENMLFMFPSPVYVRRWLGVVPRVREPELYLATADAVAAAWKATGADGPAAAMRRTSPDVFVYRFDWDEEPRVLGTDLASYLGAAHGFEIPFVFGHYDLGRQVNVIFTAANAPAREELAARMMSYWAQFAYAGAPGRGRTGELPEWTAWDPTPGAHKTMHLDTGDDGLRMGSDPVTLEAVVASIDTDPRLRTSRDRCWVLRELARRERYVKGADYERRVECGSYAYDRFPW
jgi:para-nitrobenzyl esterase